MARWGEAAGSDDAHSQDAAAHLAAGIRDALSGGDDGYWDDWAAVLTPWGCDLTATRVPVRLWHGVRDQAVPIVHGHWLAANIPGIRADLAESDDHATTEHNHKNSAYAWLSALT